MADQGDKQQRARHKKATSKKRVVTRSRSRNHLNNNPELDSSDTTHSSDVELSSSPPVYFIGESDSHLKRKHPTDTADKSAKKSRGQQSNNNKPRSSSHKSKMSSSSSQSLNESPDDNSTSSDVVKDFSVLDDDNSHNELTAVHGGSSVLSSDGSSGELIILTTDSDFALEEPLSSQDKGLMNNAPGCSLACPEEETETASPPPEFLIPIHAEEGTEFREIIRKRIINIKNTIGDNLFSSSSSSSSSRTSSKKHGQRKKVMNCDSKSSDAKETKIDNNLRLGSSGQDDKTGPSHHHHPSVHIMMDDFDLMDPAGAGCSQSSTKQQGGEIADSSLVQVVKLSSSALSKRTRHHASSAKGDSAKAPPAPRSGDEFLSGSLVAALDTAEMEAVASFASSSSSSSQEGGATAASGSSGADPAHKDSELGRLQALLEARGIPLHVFGALGHRMQHLIHRSMGSSSSNGRVQQLLQGLQANGDEGRQLQALVEMCQLLVMGNEDTLVGFPVKQVVPVLIHLLSMESHFEMMNNACRALTYLMEALPRSSSVVVDAVPVFLHKIQVIQCMDVAEQSLTALEMLSKWHNKAILHAKGVSICLTYLDFFSIGSQRSALAIVANCCQNLLPNEFPLVHDSLPVLSGWLSRQDEKSVESICLAFSRLVECFQFDTKHLKEIASRGLLSNVLELLLLTPSILSTQTFTTVTRMLALVCASCPELAILLLNLNVAETLCFLLTGSSSGEGLRLTPRSHQELLEISFLICELMPCLPTDGIFAIDPHVLRSGRGRRKDFVVWKWRDDSGAWQSYSVSDSKLIETAYQSGVDTFRHTAAAQEPGGETVTTLLDLNALHQVTGDDASAKRPLKRQLSSFSDAVLQHSDSAAKVDPFRENSELVNNCVKSLFPVLYEIYCSSAGPSIRYNCLRAMLRMVYFAPAPVLELVLQSQLLSRNIAAMLASPDLKVLVSALQMAHLLLQKLPEVFGVHFVREGVMHEIRVLAAADVGTRVSESAATPFENIAPLPGGGTLFRPPTANLLTASKSFEFITSLQQSAAQDSVSPSSSGGRGGVIRKESSTESNEHAKIFERKSSTKEPPSAARKDSPSVGGQASCSAASDRYDKVNAWIRDMAQKFEDFFSGERFEASHPATNVLFQLTSAVSRLEDPQNGREALSQICSIMTERDISSFEFIHSHLIKRLYAFLTVPPKCSESDLSALEDRLRLFLHVFVGSPLAPSPDFDPSATNPAPLVTLIEKLNACVSHLEQFPVKVHDISTRHLSRRGTNALRFFNTHHLKCLFQRHPDCANLRQWRGGPVMIDPLASVHNIDQYLVSQGYAALRSEEEEEDDDDENEDEEDEEDSDQSEDNSEENLIDIAAALRLHPSHPETQKLQFLVGNNVLPSNMTLYQAIKQYAAHAESDGGGGHDVDAEDPLGLASIWTKTHILSYRPHPPEVAAAPPPEPAAVSSTEIVLTRSKADRKKKQSPTTESSHHRKGSRREEQQKPEKAKGGDCLWNDGTVPEANPLLCFAQGGGGAPETSSGGAARDDPSLEVIHLLRVVHALNAQWGSLCGMNAWERCVPQSLFVNQKLTLKANRQLQDLISVMTGSVPPWLSHVAREFPFLLPFQTRYLVFYVTSFDKDRALQRVIDVMPEVRHNDRIAPKFEKRKRTISREGLLKQAESVLQDVAHSRAVLEIQYKNEVGTGLGPTLEFYALVSRELQRADLDMWRGDKTVAQNGKGTPTNYVFSPSGLFPLPLPRNVKQSTLTKVCNRFRLLGNFLAKSVMDSRLLDIPLSKTFYRWILNQESSLSLADLQQVDEEIARTAFKLERIVAQKRRLERELSHDAAALTSALEGLTLDGCPLEDLHLDFTLPGYPHVEMRRGGRDIPVTIHNLEQYLKLLRHWTTREGVWRQMRAFREGFETVFPLRHLQIFYPEELELLFCGSEHSRWDEKTLAECCRSDHGYTHESRAIKFLFEILGRYDPGQQRLFLQFITGSPRLPVGGLKSLSPPLTVVKKTADDATDCDDRHLPSVMTCVNYLKLPDYSTLEVMRQKLDMAVNEGQHSFHLS